MNRYVVPNGKHMATEEGLRDLLAVARGESPSGDEPEYIPGHVVPKGRHMASEETLQEVIAAISGGGSGTAIDLGITGASVGEVPAVASVDADGKPTAWMHASAASASSVPDAGSVSSTGLMSIKHGSTTLFTVQLPLYVGGVS